MAGIFFARKKVMGQMPHFGAQGLPRGILGLYAWFEAEDAPGK